MSKEKTKKPTQVVVIHGGDTFETYEEYLADLKTQEFDMDRLRYKDWKSTLGEKLGPTYEVIAPVMPSKNNAKYIEWKIWFDKVVPFLRDGVILIGHSLGGIFLAKYLSENKLPKKIAATFLLAAPFAAAEGKYSLADFVLPEDLSLILKQSGAVHLYHSEDDPVVSYGDVKEYKKRLPTAILRTFTDREHLWQEEFPEIVADIKAVS